MGDKKRSKEELKMRSSSDQSFRLWDKNNKLIGHMEEGKWIKKPKEKK